MTQIVKLAGRDVAIGLTWVGEIGEDDKSTAKKVLASTNLQQAVVFGDSGSGMTFVGYGEGNKRWLKVPSAAAWMALAQEENSRGVLVQRVGDDSYWVVAVGHNQILFETDVVVSARSAAEQVESLLARIPDIEVMVGPGCDDVLAEAMWQPGGEASFDQFFADAKPPRAAFARQVIGMSRSAGLAIIAVAGLLMLGGLWFGVREYQRRVEAEERAAAQAAAAVAAASELERERERRIVAAVRAAVREDTKLVDPAAFVAACHALTNHLGHLTLAGWHLTRVQCTGERRRAELTFELGDVLEGGVGTAATLAGLREELRIKGFKVTGSIGGRGYDGKLTLDLPLEVRPGIAAPADLPDLESVLNGWFSAAQLAFQGLAGSLRWTPPTPRSVMYKDPEAEKTMAAKRNPSRAMRPVPPEKSFRTGTVRFEMDESYVVDSVLKALTARTWLSLTTARFEIGGVGQMQVSIDVKYVVK